MSKPRPGTYYIIDRVNSAVGNRLVVTFNGQGNALTLTPLTYADAQKWIIADYVDGSNQSFTPYSAQSLQAALGSGVVIALPANAYVFFARVGPTGMSIQSGNGSVPSWGCATAIPNSQVTFLDGLGDEKYLWALQVV